MGVTACCTRSFVLLTDRVTAALCASREYERIRRLLERGVVPALGHDTRATGVAARSVACSVDTCTMG